MKVILALFTVFTISTTAFADQTISCQQINTNGSLKTKGIGLILTMTSKSSGYAEVKGLHREAVMNGLNELEVRSINQGTAIDKSKYTTVFLAPKIDDEMLDIQLQFKAIVIGKNFSDTHADFVIGSEDANPETGFAFGYNMICNSEVD